MAPSLPQSNEPLNLPSHSHLHRVIAASLGASEQSLIVNDVGDTIVGRNLSINNIDVLGSPISSILTVDGSNVVKSRSRALLASDIVGDLDHNSLDGLNAGDYRHLTEIEYEDLTDGGETILHEHTVDAAMIWYDGAGQSLSGSGWQHCEFTDGYDTGADSLEANYAAGCITVHRTGWYHITASRIFSNHLPAVDCGHYMRISPYSFLISGNYMIHGGQCATFTVQACMYLPEINFFMDFMRSPVDSVNAKAETGMFSMTHYSQGIYLKWSRDDTYEL